jgi:hypothetical protein
MSTKRIHNNSLMTNRRYQPPLSPKLGLGREVYALLLAAVRYAKDRLS